MIAVQIARHASAELHIGVEILGVDPARIFDVIAEIDAVRPVALPATAIGMTNDKRNGPFILKM
jgi:hypothetical protein